MNKRYSSFKSFPETFYFSTAWPLKGEWMAKPWLGKKRNFILGFI
jgi:hypothetical protein